ncbi:phytoene/squalene synthase family protein [Alteripontixanthobacter maritimus]|nr:phytoene/squalene synthase family protein [Alteripontixanthobacter maritimus]
MRETPQLSGGGRHRAVLVQKARESIAKGSVSFDVASRLFDKDTRERAWLLYAWARKCDDIADEQDHGHKLGEQANKQDKVQAIRVLTQRAMDGLPTADPAFDGFGVVARECGITMEMANDVIAGFRLDAGDWRPKTEGDMMRYCYHVAGAVGVMMARVMGVSAGDSETLDRACDLGLAFQLANISRDVVEDDAVGRCYLPANWLVEKDFEPGQHAIPANRFVLASLMPRMIALMEHHEAWARVGIKQLGFRQRWAVLSAARIYGAIGRRVLDRGQLAWNSRTVIGPLEKAAHVTAAFGEALANNPAIPENPPRWTRTELQPPKGW